MNEAGGIKAFLFHRGFAKKLKALDNGYAFDKVGCTGCSCELDSREGQDSAGCLLAAEQGMRQGLSSRRAQSGP